VKIGSLFSGIGGLELGLLPARMDGPRRIGALGNAVVPQCAEVIGRIISDDVRRAQ
jgi:site-specific DNA-cytosine methylase